MVEPDRTSLADPGCDRRLSTSRCNKYRNFATEFIVECVNFIMFHVHRYSRNDRIFGSLWPSLGGREKVTLSNITVAYS